MKITDELWDLQRYQSKEKIISEINKLLDDSLPEKIRIKLEKIRDIEHTELMLNKLDRLRKDIENGDYRL